MSVAVRVCRRVTSLLHVQYWVHQSDVILLNNTQSNEYYKDVQLTPLKRAEWCVEYAKPL